MHNSPEPIIIAENETLVAVNKPSGLLTIPDRFDAKLPSLRKYLQNRYGTIFVVHRLDRDTSGLILFAKTEEAHAYYSQAFEDRKVVKTYLGLVHGSPLQSTGTIDKPIAKHRVIQGRMMVHRNGKPSVTHYKVMQHFGLYSLVEFGIETGRTHQIRVHMAHVGHPLLGDPLYATGFRTKAAHLSEPARAALEALGRQALHAARLGFEHPVTGEWMEFESEPPADMQALLATLRG